MNATTTTGGCRCGRCHRMLKSPQAIEAGYGAVCYRKTFGSGLPGKSRAHRAEKKDTNTRNTDTGRSDFDCHLRTGSGGPGIIVIEDLDAGGMSVTNNIEAVVAEAARRLEVNPGACLIIYRDSDGTYDGVRASIGAGQYGFYHLGQQSEEAAIKAALTARGASA